MEISILISVAAFLISFFSLYYTSLKSVDLNFIFEPKARDIEKDVGKNEVPYVLHFDVDMYTWNNGNNPGIVRKVQVRFFPSPTFRKFILENRISEPQESIGIPAKGTKYKSYSIFVSLINILRDIPKAIITDIESETLSSLLDDMKGKKIQNIRELLIFLQKNRYLGELEVSWEYTYSPLKILPIKFKKRIKRLPIEHCYENYLEKYKFWIDNFKLEPQTYKIINGAIEDLRRLKSLYIKNLQEYRRHGKWRIDANLEPCGVIYQYRFVLLRKCRKYKNTVKIIEKPHEVICAFLEHMEKCRGAYLKDNKQKVEEEVEIILKNFEEETHEALTEIDFLVPLINGELNAVIGNK